MTTLTPELRRELANAGEQPVRIEDPVTQTAYVILKADVYDKMRAVLEVEKIDPSPDGAGDFDPRATYPAVDRVFAAGWDDPKMADYDDYENHRP